MPKMKTKSGAKKRFKMTASGKVKAGVSGKRHGMIKRTPKQIRQNRGMDTCLSRSDAKIVKKYMPYAAKEALNMSRVKRENHPRPPPQGHQESERLLRPPQEHHSASPIRRWKSRPVRLSRPPGAKAELPRPLDPAHQRRLPAKPGSPIPDL